MWVDDGFLPMLPYNKMYGHKFMTVDLKNGIHTCVSCVYFMSGKNKLTLNKRKWI